MHAPKAKSNALVSIRNSSLLINVANAGSLMLARFSR